MAGGVVLRGISHAAPRNLSFTCSSTGLRRLLVSGPVDRLAGSPATCVPASVLASRVPATGAPVRRFHSDTSHCAGHNKWSKVKHIKGPRDEARGKMFMKYGMMIRIAVKEGGPNPDFNATLAQILEQCRGHNMPKASIDAAIKNAEKAKTGTQHTYEGRGPGGFALLIEVLTDNNTRTNQDIKHLLKTNGGVLSDGARHAFDRKGVVVAEAGSVSLEEALELAIEAGAEDVREMEEEEERPMLQFICGQAELTSVRTWLENRGGIHIVSSGLEFVSHTPLVLDHTQLEAASVLLEALNDCSDVLRVWDNIQAEH